MQVARIKLVRKEENVFHQSEEKGGNKQANKINKNK